MDICTRNSFETVLQKSKPSVWLSVQHVPLMFPLALHQCEHSFALWGECQRRAVKSSTSLNGTIFWVLKILGPFLVCQQIDQLFFIMKVTSQDIFRWLHWSERFMLSVGSPLFNGNWTERCCPCETRNLPYVSSTTCSNIPCTCCRYNYSSTEFVTLPIKSSSAFLCWYSSTLTFIGIKFCVRCSLSMFFTEFNLLRSQEPHNCLLYYAWSTLPALMMNMAQVSELWGITLKCCTW